MLRLKQKNNGVITVLVSMMLVGVLSIGTLVIEAGRFQAAKTQLAEATISTSTSMIAAYDSDFYARYGILAIETDRFTENRAMDYMQFNSDVAPGWAGNRISTMYKVESVELEGLYNLTYPSVLKRQILSRAKYHVIPQDNALNVYNYDSFFIDFQNKCKYVADKLEPVANGYASTGAITDVPPEMLVALKALYETFKDLKRSDPDCDITLNGGTTALLPSVTGTVESPVLSQDIADINASISDATSVLGGSGAALGYNSGTGLAEVDVSVDASFVSSMHTAFGDVATLQNLVGVARNLASKTRQMAQGFNAAINTLNADKEGNLLFNSYISSYFSNRNNRISTYQAPAKGTHGSMNNATFSSACVEYFFGADASEQNNQSVAHAYIQAVRLINNLYIVMTESSTFRANNVYSVAAHLAWANYESIIDAELLSKYNVSVPFGKNRMILPMNNASGVAAAFATKDVANGLKGLGLYNAQSGKFVVGGSNAYSYTDSLALALWFIPNSEKTLRIADLMQLEMRYREQYVEKKAATFLMSEQNTYCRVKTKASLVSILPMTSLDSGESANGIEFQSVKYAGY